MSRRAPLLASLLAAAALAGCGGSDERVRFQVFGGPDEIALYEEVVAAYERETGERVRLVPVPDREAHLQKVATGFAGGTPPDVFLVNYRNFAGYAARGALDPAGPRLDRSRALRRERYHPGPLDAFTYDGELQCMPQNASSLVVYFNRELFRRAGVPLPRAGWTYEEFLRAARRLTTPDPASGRPIERYGVGIEPSIVRLAAFAWSAGGDLVDDPREPERFVLDAPASRRGLDALLDLQGLRVAPSETEVESRPLEDRFADGTVAMLLSSRREVPTLRRTARFDWDVASFPRLERPATVLHSDAYCLAKGERAGAAWRFVEFAAGPEGQRILARGGRIVPSLRSVARSRDFLDPGRRPRSSEVFLEAIPHARALPVAPRWSEVEDAADLALKRAYYQEMTAEQAIARIRRATDRLFEDRGERPAG